MASFAETAAGADGAFTSIPIIDLGKCGTPEGRLATGHEIRDACTRVGFFYVRNHGIPQSCVEKVFTATQAYFSLPTETKMKLHHRLATNFKGFHPLLDSNIDSANNDKGDFHEAFLIGWEEIEVNELDEKSVNAVTPNTNVWPSDDCPGFREACLEYYHAAVNVSKVLFPLFALALGLPETYFDDKMRHFTPSMKVNHYPLQDGHPEMDDDTPGVGAHTDFECFTILWQQPGIQALQVMNSEKQWVDAPPIKDTLVINIGDQLSLWTNDVFTSTVHRATSKSGEERYSIPIFFGAERHVNIEPMPSYVTADRPAIYSSITAGEHVDRRYKNMYNIA